MVAAAWLMLLAWLAPLPSLAKMLAPLAVLLWPLLALPALLALQA